MPRKPPPEPQSALKNWSPSEIPGALTKLEQLKGELSALRGRRFDDPQVEVVTNNVVDTILELYGPSSPEYERLKYFEISDGPKIIGAGNSHWQQNFERGIAAGITKIDGLSTRLRSKAEELSTSPDAVASDDFSRLQLHQQIVAVSKKLFDGGHHAEAVFAATKVLVNMVKERARISDKDGQPLMMMVFSEDNPVLQFNALRDEADRDEQRGYRFLFAGAVQAIRNPSAHSFPEIPPRRALQYLSFLSLLAERLDDATPKLAG